MIIGHTQFFFASCVSPPKRYFYKNKRFNGSADAHSSVCFESSTYTSMYISVAYLPRKGPCGRDHFYIRPNPARINLWDINNLAISASNSWRPRRPCQMALDRPQNCLFNLRQKQRKPRRYSSPWFMSLLEGNREVHRLVPNIKGNDQLYTNWNMIKRIGYFLDTNSTG